MTTEPRPGEGPASRLDDGGGGDSGGDSGPEEKSGGLGAPAPGHGEGESPPPPRGRSKSTELMGRRVLFQAIVIVALLGLLAVCSGPRG